VRRPPDDADVLTAAPDTDDLAESGPASEANPARPQRVVTERARRIATFVVLTALAWLPLFFWYAAFRPGIMSADSLGSWWQASTGRVTDDIAPTYTFLMYVSQRLVGSPSGLALFQQALLASSFVAVGWSLVHLGVRRWVVGIVTAGLLVTPMVGAFSVSLWKDIPYSAAMLYCGAAVVWLVKRQLDGATTVRAMQAPLLMLLVAASVAVLIRQNGVLFSIILGVILTAALKGVRRWIIAGTACTVLVLVSLKTVVFPILGVAPTPEPLKVASLLHDIAAVNHHHPGDIPEDVALEMETIAPLDTWSRSYSCYTVNPLYYSSEVDLSILEENSITDSWIELLIGSPGTVVGHRVCAGSIAWRPMAVDRANSVLYTVSTGIDANDVGLETRPIWERLHRFGIELIEESNEPQREWYLWRAPTWIYLCYAALGFAAVRNRSPRLLLPGSVLLAAQLTVLLVNPAQDARYMMGGLMLAVLLLPIATLRLPRDVVDRSADSDSDTTTEDDALADTVSAPPAADVS
jgi:hypothetical protein